MNGQPLSKVDPYNPTQRTCPTPAQWEAALRGHGDAATWSAIESHLLECSACEATVDRLTELSDTCVRSLCRVPVQPQDEEVFQSLYQRLLSSPQLADVNKGSTLDKLELPHRLGNYELIEPLGHGANGSVFKGRHVLLGRSVAVKLLRPDLDVDQDGIDRFLQEVSAIGKLDHPNTVRATDAGVIDGQHFLVMEFVSGTDVSSVLLKHGQLRVADACEIARQAAVGLAYIHENGFVHRDVKPSNLLLTARGVTKLLDLGLVQAVGNGLQREESGKLPHGTADYMAPEQWLDFDRVDFRCDLYSLGCTLAKLLTGLPPYRPLPSGFASKFDAHCEAEIPELRSLRKNIPETVCEVFHRLMAKAPEERFPSATAVADALSVPAENADLSAVARSCGLEPEPTPSVRGRRVLPRLSRREAMLAGGAFAASGILALGYLSRRRRPRDYYAIGEPRPLAVAQPALLLPWQVADDSTDRRSQFWSDMGGGRIAILSPEQTLINLGQPVRHHCVISVAIEKSSAYETAGIFYNFVDDWEARGLQEFRSVELVRDGGSVVTRLEWRAHRVRAAVAGEAVTSVTWAKANVDASMVANPTLEVELGSTVFPVVRWQNRTLSRDDWEFSERGQVQAAGQLGETLGGIGLIASNRTGADETAMERESAPKAGTIFLGAELCYL